jgi:hypothetical protein
VTPAVPAGCTLGRSRPRILDIVAGILHESSEDESARATLLLEEVVVRDGIRVREISKEEGQRLPRIVCRSSGSVVTWRRAQMVLLSAQGMDVARIAKVTSADRVRALLHNFNHDAFPVCRRQWRPSSTPPPSPAGDLYRSPRCRHLLAPYDLGRDRLYGHVKVRTRYIASRNSHADNHAPRELVKRANGTSSVAPRSIVKRWGRLAAPPFASGCCRAVAGRSPAPPIDAIDPAAPMDKMDPAEPMERIEPAEPIDSTDPAEPTDSTDPAEPIDNSEPTDHIEQIDQAERWDCEDRYERKDRSD